MPLRKNILGDYILSSDTLSNIHWFLLLKFAKAVVCFGLLIQTSNIEYNVNFSLSPHSVNGAVYSKFTVTGICGIA